MKKQFVIVIVLVCSFICINAFAQKNKKDTIQTLDEIVVTATKFRLKKENTGKVVTKISQRDLQQNAGKSVIEVLNTIAGIDVKGVNANPTEPRSINIRGGRSRQILVLIDGVPVTDQSAINQEFDLRLLAISQIEEIEVLKGASSTLYGSGAATAVINIILKKASKNKVSGSFETSLGTNNTASVLANFLSDKQQNVNVNGTLGNFNFFTSFSVIGIDGMSSAKSTTTTIFETDAFYSKNGMVKLGYNSHKKLQIEAFFNSDDFEYDFDQGAFLDNNQNQGNQKQTRFGIKPSLKYDGGQFYALVSVNEVKRNLHQFNSFSNTLDAYQFIGKSINLDVVNKYSFSNHIQLITGINYQEHTNQTTTPFAIIEKSLANFTTLDPYASLVFVSDSGYSFNIGGRLNIHNVYGNQLVYDGNMAYSILKNKTSTLKLFSSYSTAFIAPSLYQLYDGFAGNTNLQPEINETLEVGFDLNYQDWLQLEAVYFNRSETNAILYNNSTFSYSNGSSKASGLEMSTTINPASFLNLNASFTYIDRDAFEDFNDYIPKNKLVVGVNSIPFKNAFLNFTYTNVGERTFFDRYGSFVTAGQDFVLKKYQVLDVLANYKLLEEKVTFFTAITNVLNEDYTDVLGFSTRGRNYKIGVRLHF